MLEQKIQTKIQKFLQKEGFETINLIKTNRNGIADLLILPGNGICFFIEVKQETGKESKLQEYRRNQLVKNGYISIVVYGYDEFLSKYLLIKEKLCKLKKGA